jgi:hypothetical protein
MLSALGSLKILSLHDNDLSILEQEAFGPLNRISQL